jgi:hypothetical protein
MRTMYKNQILWSASKRILGCLAILTTSSVGRLCFAQDSAHCVGHAELNQYERAQFLQVSLGHRDQARAQFLSESGCGEEMLQGLARLGAKIDFADNPSGYALVTVSREKLLETLDLPGIAYAYTRDDDRMYYQDPAAKIPQSERKAEPVPAVTIPYPRVATTLPKDGPYFAADEIGLTELWKRHPEADGRSVRVAVVDAGFDLLHPALQEALDATGKSVPKIADLGTITTPEEDSGWVRFGDLVRTKDGTLEAAGRSWIVPEDGTYRFGIFKTDLMLGPEGNSKTKKLSLSVGVIWDEQINRVWVDTDGDGSFKNQRALGDYGSTHDVDWFGAKEGADDNRIPFGVKIDAARSAVYVRVGGDHGVLVAGPLAANTLTGGLFNGAAPSAQLIDAHLDANRVPSIVSMFARSDVAVINRSGGIARADYTGQREGAEDFQKRVLERLLAVYRKPMACFCSAIGTILVTDYAGAQMLRRNRQLGPPYIDTINAGVSLKSDGLVNTVFAPSANLETESRYKPFTLQWPDGTKRSSDDRLEPPAPDGYMIGANPSPTIPVVSGLLADLISEAKYEHVRYNAGRLNNAVFTGTRLLDGFPLSQQGYGLINAAQSWDQLAKMSKADDPNNPELTSFTLSRVEDGKTMEVQGFHADLSKPGEKLSGQIKITRHGGYAGGRKYTFSLRGNDGTFELLDTKATFDRDRPKRVQFRSNGASGSHLVFLELRDVKAGVVMQDVPLSVRVPSVPQSMAPGVEKYESTIQPLRSELRYVRVGEEVQATRYVMRIPFTGPCCSTRGMPGFSYHNENVSPPGPPVDAAHHVGPMETLESLVVNDEPGTQQIFWENRGRPEYATQFDGPAPDVAIHAELTVSSYAIGIQKNANDTLIITNKLAEVEGRVELYDATLKTAQLEGTSSHASGELERTLPAGLAEWRVRVTADPDSGDRTDAYLLNCSGKDGCNVVAQGQITASGKALVVEKPYEGSWKIVVRSRGQLSHPVTYSVREALLVLASTPIEQTDSRHSSAGKWTLALPAKESDAQYAAFRIAGTPGNEEEKDGLLVAVTPLDHDAP